ncbi:ANTAR domain-containing protein [Amycolatopsis thailandensis]|uniref:ANTAR domain-containing protein n=1 Tax=Amycolatopsis thailandensis TaxID=589330 RepID=A0A229SHJ9_9PSEU|nr:ANTAR domain-containing protein [Amycolatopsis thailandensis]OXM58353.1 ANTAR domain-containing protein [Amycolatopsis thailandensis]
MQNRERWVTDTLVELADTLVPALDPTKYWHCVADRYAQLVASSAVHLAAVGDHPVVINTDDRLGTAPLDRILAEEGPGVDSRDGGEQVVNVLLAEATTRWRRLSQAAVSLGYRSIHAFPFSRREDVLGAVTVLTSETTPLPVADLRIAAALADVATIGMLNHQAIAKLTTTTGQLQGALTSRVIIEQAKGLVSARLEISPEAAFLLLRRYARGHNMKIGELCASLMSRRLTVGELTVSPSKAVKAGRRR